MGIQRSHAAVARKRVSSSTAVLIDAMIDFEVASNGTPLTAALLNAADAGDVWTWTMETRDPGAHSTISTLSARDYPADPPVLVNGSPAPTSGTRSLMFDLAEAHAEGLTPVYEDATAAPPSPITKLIVSGWVYFGATGNTNGLDAWKVNGSPYLVHQQVIGDGNFPGGTAGLLRIETQHNGGITYKSTPIAIDVGWHFLELYWDGVGGEMSLLVRDTSFIFVGTSHYISNDAGGFALSTFVLQSYLDPEGGYTLHDKVGRTWKAGLQWPLWPLTVPDPTNVKCNQTGTPILEWNSKAEGYKIERKTGAGAWTVVESLIYTYQLASSYDGFNTYEDATGTDGDLYRITAYVGRFNSSAVQAVNGKWYYTIAPGSTGSSSSSDPSIMLGAQITAPVSGNVIKVSVYNADFVTVGGFRAGLYTALNAKLDEGVRLASTMANTFGIVTLANAVPVIASTIYWIIFIAQNSNSYTFRFLNLSGLVEYAFGYSYAGGLPATYIPDGTAAQQFCAGIYIEA